MSARILPEWVPVVGVRQRLSGRVRLKAIDSLGLTDICHDSFNISILETRNGGHIAKPPMVLPNTVDYGESECGVTVMARFVHD